MSFSRFSVKTHGQTEFINITSEVRSFLESEKIDHGLCHVYIPHTTAGVTINEAADPDVEKDILKELNKIVPFRDNYAHLEGNSAAHIKTTIVGSSVTIPIAEGRLNLGTWQGIFFCEFDGPRNRSVYLTIL